MSKLDWKDKYCIGNESIDAEHKRLVDIANEILNINNPLMETPRIALLVKELYGYMQEHFEHEEAYMESISFGEIEEHKAMHDSIVTEMNDMLKMSKDYIQLDNLLVILMKEWVLRHIAEEDVKHCKAQAVESYEIIDAALQTDETPNPT